MPRHALQHAVIYSGSAVSSGFVAVAGGDLFGVWCPVVTSAANLFIQGAFALVGTDPVSADFVRLQNPAGSGDWAGNIITGSKAYTLQDPAFPFTHLRLETSATQTDTRSFVVVVKFRTGVA